MVKKNKSRQLQESPLSQGGDSAESCDQKKSIAGSLCPHIQKAVHLASVKKALKNGCLASECPGCVKENFKSESGEDAQATELWLCLQCGHQGCGRTHQQHALKHFKVVHSDPHCLAVNTTTWSIWCYHCEVKLDSEYRKKLHECVKYLRNLDYPSLRGSIKSSTSDGSKEIDPTDSNSILPLSDVTNVPHGVRGAAKKRISVNLPRVRGLHNLGNTCFFNSVMQCLAQTPHFLELLQDMRLGGSKICLPGGKGLLRKPDTKPSDEEDDDELPPLEVSLAKWGSLTETLTSTLEELRLDDATAVNPQKLFNKLTTKWPQFGGGDQHDAHELLRHLLDEVRTEDLKRYWTGILDEYGLSRHDTSETVESSVRTQVRAYGKQAGEQLLLPDPVFRGILVSTVECQDCLHSYQRTEPFYELSLPVTTNKPQPPVMRRKIGAEDSFDVCGNPASETPSKHQLKKERRQQRKGRKKGQNSQNKNSPSLETMSEATIAEEPSCNTAESEQSDADIEDNVEQDTAIKKRNMSTEVLINGEVALPLDISLCNGDSSETELFVRSTKVVDRTVSENICNGNSESSLELKVCNSFNSESRTVDECQNQSNKDNVTGTLIISKEAIVDPISKIGSSVSKCMEKDIPELRNLQITENNCEVPLRTSEIVENNFALMNTTLKENGISCEGESAKDDNHNKISWSVNGPSTVPESVTRESVEDEESANETKNVQSQSATCLEAVEPSEMSFQLMKDSFILNKAHEELSLSISVGPNTPSALGSPVSNTGSPSSISSDMNVELNHSNNLSPGNWMNDETDRPFSRIAFCNDEDTVPNVEATTPVDGKENDCMNRSLICDKEVLTADQLSKEMASLTLGHEDCQSPSHWDTCSAHSTEDTKDAKSLLPLEVSMCNGVSRSSDPEPADDGDKSATLAPRYHCGDKECSIESCLNQFTLLELMTGSCKVICESCSERVNRGKVGKMVATNSTKQYLVSNPPAVLVLHLKRFELHQNVFRKTPRHVTFPMLLDIAPICNTKCRELSTMRKGQTKVLYSLYGVVQHSGTLHGGHYSAYVKVRTPVKRDDMRWCFLPTSQSCERLEELSKTASIPTEPVPGKWYHVSDSRVNEVNEDRVLHSQAYLLFYERVW